MKLNTVTVQQAYLAIRKNNNQQLIDVRSTQECVKGMAEGAQHIELDELSQVAKKQFTNNNTYYLICQSGHRSALAIEKLRCLGFERLYQIDKGYQAWLEAGLPVSYPQFDDYQLRYSRHIQLKGFGPHAQKKLSKAHVLVIGAGGLGSPCLLYLSASGVGRISVIDDDFVELSNLHRQILHRNDTIGKLKVDSASECLNKINPHIHIETFDQRLTISNIEEMIKKVDIVIDGSDNLETRYLVNDTCLKYHKPMMYASVYQYEYQVSTFDFTDRNQACLRCLFPETLGFEPQNCSDTGVLGTVPGIAGVMQATEAIKKITGVGKCLSNQLLLGDVLSQRSRIIKFSKDPQCVCH